MLFCPSEKKPNYYQTEPTGFPEPTARASKSNVLAVKAGEMGTVTRDYEKITGRMPRSFRQLLAHNRDKYLNMYAPGKS